LWCCQAVFHLQQKGVCHREISLENILLDENDQLVLIDPGMSLRVPYSDPYNYGCATDASAGGSRLLMIAQGQGGKLMYAPPELVNREEIVDAFAIDLWAVGVVLFVMLVGLAPFKWAHATDQRFSKISEGGLKELMEMFEIPLSPEACDLLQGFFYGDPRKRLTLAEIMTHPWVQGKRFVNTSVRVQGQGKRFVNTSMNAAAIAPKKFTFSLQDLRKPDESPRTSPRRIGKKTKIQQPERSSRRGTVETPPF
jgi:serine/threonine protein kinase